jgi:hypothetical protein
MFKIILFLIFIFPYLFADLVIYSIRDRSGNHFYEYRL